MTAATIEDVTNNACPKPLTIAISNKCPARNIGPAMSNPDKQARINMTTDLGLSRGMKGRLDLGEVTETTLFLFFEVQFRQLYHG
jgi:hypothetical protein